MVKSCKTAPVSEGSQAPSQFSSPTDPPPPAWTPFISSQLLETPSDNTSKLIIVKTCKMFSHISYATLSQSASSSRTKPNFRKQHPEVLEIRKSTLSCRETFDFSKVETAANL